MASYDVALTSSAEKELKKLSGQLIARIVPRLENLASNPRPSGCKKLRGGDEEWGIRVGDSRVVYTIQTTSSTWHARAPRDGTSYGRNSQYRPAGASTWTRPKRSPGGAPD